MGEIADMMLEGDLCEGCGSFLEGEGDGVPRYCRDCKAEKRKLKYDARQVGAIAEKQRYWLEIALSQIDNPPGMYPGVTVESAPGQFRKLIARGLVEEYVPHNPVHKRRAIITDLGRAALRENL